MTFKLSAVKMDPTVRLTRPGSTPVPTSACIVQIHGEPLGHRIEFGSSEITVGRDDDNTAPVQVTSVSRRHARLWQQGSECWVEDLDSTNGSLRNGEEFRGAIRLLNGDLLNLGGAIFKFLEGGNIETLYHEEIHRIAVTDGLTQVANKRHLLEFLSREISGARRHQRTLSLALFDIDHFKRVNDDHGHLAGDLVLRQVADVVRDHVRQDELLARYGGEEFVVVLPAATVEEGASFAERIRQGVESHVFHTGAHAIDVTISVGVAALSEGMTPDELIAEADTLLYEAKRAGRNRIVWRE